MALLWPAGYVAAGMGMGRLIFPKAGKLRGPVVAYVVAILTMAWLGAVSALAGGGAALFVVSDGLPAYDRFVRPLPHARLLVLTTYWLAQWLIALSIRA